MRKRKQPLVNEKNKKRKTNKEISQHISIINENVPHVNQNITITNKNTPKNLIKETIELETVEGEIVEGETIEGGTVEGETIEGGTVEGETVEGETVEGETVEGETVVSGGEIFENFTFFIKGKKFQQNNSKSNRKKMKEIIETSGGRVQSSPSKETNFILLGNEIKPEDIKKYSKFNVPIIKDTFIHYVVEKKLVPRTNETFKELPHLFHKLFDFAYLNSNEICEDNLFIKYKSKKMDIFDLELLTHSLKEKGGSGGWNQLNKSINDKIQHYWNSINNIINKNSHNFTDLSADDLKMFWKKLISKNSFIWCDSIHFINLTDRNKNKLIQDKFKEIKDNIKVILNKECIYNSLLAEAFPKEKEHLLEFIDKAKLDKSISQQNKKIFKLNDFHDMMTNHISGVHVYQQEASKFLENQNKSMFFEQQMQLLEFEFKKEQYINMYLQNQKLLKELKENRSNILQPIELKLKLLNDKENVNDKYLDNNDEEIQ